MTEPRISVAICSYQGADQLPTVLGALRRQTLDPSAYEVLVVDDGSTDDTAGVAAQWGARVAQLRQNGGLANARNVALAQARAPLIAYTDDDCEPHEDWLAELLRAFDDPQVDGVSGRVVSSSTDGFMLRYLDVRSPLAPLGADLLESTNRVHRLVRYLRGVASPRTEEPGRDLYSVVGANMAFRTSALRDVGGFDAAFRFGAEEEELCRRLHERPGGTTLRYHPEAVIGHVFEPDVATTLKRSRSYGRGNARTALKHHDRAPIVFPFPLLLGMAAAGALVTRRRGALALLPLLPQLLYFGWPLSALRERRPEQLAYPYLQSAQETASMVGQWQGWRAGYVPEPGSHELV